MVIVDTDPECDSKGSGPDWPSIPDEGADHSTTFSPNAHSLPSSGPCLCPSPDGSGGGSSIMGDIPIREERRLCGYIRNDRKQNNSAEELKSFWMRRATMSDRLRP